MHYTRSRIALSVRSLLKVRLRPTVGTDPIYEQVIRNHLTADSADSGSPGFFSRHFHPHPLVREDITPGIDELIDERGAPRPRVEERIFCVPEGERRILADLLTIDEDPDSIDLRRLGLPVHGDGKLPYGEDPEAAVADRAAGDHLQGVRQTPCGLADSVDLLTSGRIQEFQGIVHHEDPDQEPGSCECVKVDTSPEIIYELRIRAFCYEPGFDIIRCMIQSWLHGVLFSQGYL